VAGREKDGGAGGKPPEGPTAPEAGDEVPPDGLPPVPVADFRTRGSNGEAWRLHEQQLREWREQLTERLARGPVAIGNGYSFQCVTPDIYAPDDPARATFAEVPAGLWLSTLGERRTMLIAPPQEGEDGQEVHVHDIVDHSLGAVRLLQNLRASQLVARCARKGVAGGPVVLTAVAHSVDRLSGLLTVVSEYELGRRPATPPRDVAYQIQACLLRLMCIDEGKSIPPGVFSERGLYDTRTAGPVINARLRDDLHLMSLSRELLIHEELLTI
jgi:hypothetical protein